jgi:hypothetical protein
MMASGKARLGALPLVLLLGSGVVVACGEAEQPEASGGPQTAATSLSADEGLENRPPEIASIRFEPADVKPGKLVNVRVAASDPDREPIELGYTWKINGRGTPSSGSTFDIPSNLRRGDRIEVSIIASDGKANSEPAVQTALIGNSAPAIQEININVLGNEGTNLGQLVADPVAQDPDDDEISFRYSWIVNGKRMEGESAELERAPLKRGDEIQLVVLATDGEAESAPLKSAPFTIENSPPDIHSRPPAPDRSGRFVYAVQASDRDGDRGLRYSLEQGPEGMTIDGFGGEVHWQATSRDAGEHMVAIAVDDRHGGITNQTFYVQVGTGPAKQR